jgi:GntR family transcriptional regulator
MWHPEPVSESPRLGLAVHAEHPEPLWVQAGALLRAQVVSGALPPGSRLPPERELSQALAISRVTLRKALGQLVADGVLTPAHGRGWFVTSGQQAVRKEWPNRLESFSETAARMGLVPSSRVLRAAPSPADLDVAEELGIAPGTPLFHLQRVRLLSGVPIAVDHTRIALKLVPDIGEQDFTTASLYACLTAAGVEPARADSTIEAQEADAELAALLDLDVGKPLLVMRQVALDGNERPLFTSSIKYAGDRYRLRTSFSRTS